MSEHSTINALRGALEPVEALRCEHSQMEQWIRESLASLEQLHDELNTKQNELQRREAQLASRDSAPSSGDPLAMQDRIDALEAEVERLQRQLNAATPQSD